jgi:peptidylprolyl isomerase
MRDILISSAVCVACLLLALVSQLVNPTTVQAANPGGAAEAAVLSSPAPASAPARPAVTSRFELDPDDPNPTLFVMASDNDQTSGAEIAQASGLGGELKGSFCNKSFFSIECFNFNLWISKRFKF